MTTHFKFELRPEQHDLAALAEFIAEAEEDYLSPALWHQHEKVARTLALQSVEPLTEAIAARYQAMRLFVRG